MNTRTNTNPTQAGSSARAPATTTGAQSDGGVSQGTFGQDNTSHSDGGHNDNPPPVPVAVLRSAIDSAISLVSDVVQQDQDQRVEAEGEDEGIFLDQDTVQEPVNIHQWQQWIQNNYLNYIASNANTESLDPEDETEDDQVNSSSSPSTSTSYAGPC